jgi:hypothetical protein
MNKINFFAVVIVVLYLEVLAFFLAASCCWNLMFWACRMWVDPLQWARRFERDLISQSHGMQAKTPYIK